MMRRRGRPLMRAAATTAVVAGTAGAVRHHQEQKYANQAAEQQAADQSAYEQGVAAGQAAAAPAPAPALSGGIDLEQLKQLGELHDSGVLSDEEFAAAKAKVLAGG
jgi:ABC-type amino acid transport substrate-binding protein